MEPEVIYSTANKRISQLRSMLRNPPVESEGTIVVEGPKLLNEAVNGGLKVEAIFVAHSKITYFQSGPFFRKFKGMIFPVTDKLFNSLTDTVTSQGILSKVRFPVAEIDPLLEGNPLLLIAHQLQDPGNLGTIIRSGEAFGIKGVLLTNQTVNFQNQKAIRASSGSLFRVPIVSKLDPHILVKRLKNKRIRLVAASPNGEHDFRDFNYKGGLALIIGSESRGIGKDFEKDLDLSLKVPMSGAVNSLNVAIATAIILCEASRRRIKSN